MKNSKSPKIKLVVSEVSPSAISLALAPSTSFAQAANGASAPAMILGGAQKLFTRFSFDDNGGGYEGL